MKLYKKPLKENKSMRMNRRPLRESESQKNTVTFIFGYEIHYEDNNVGGRTFDQTFDDSCLYNGYSYHDPGRDVAGMVETDFEEMGPTGLAQYIGDYEGELQDCVESIVGRFDVKKSHLEMKCVLKPGVDPKKVIKYVNGSENTVIEALKSYITGQLSDGWGEGFEQQPIAVGTVYAVYNENEDYDCEWFSDERSAMSDCESKNDHSEDEDDEDYDESNYDHYDWTSDDITAYYSFWSSKFDTLRKVLINGLDENGFDDDGYDKDGFDLNGRDRDGFDKSGYDSKGFDKEGFGKDGFNREGKDREGFDKKGEKPMNNKRPVNKSGKEQGAVFNVTRDGKVRIANTFDMGESRKKPNKKALKEALICSPTGSFTHSVSGSQKVMGYKGLQESEETGNFILIAGNTALNQAEEITGLSPILSECSEDVIGNYLEVSIDEAEQFNDVGFAIYSYDDIIQAEGKIIEIVDNRVYLEDPISYRNEAM